jgi:UrcA family protein
MQRRNSPLVIAALLAGMSLTTAAPAAAQEPQDVSVYGESLATRTERVAFADLNLASLSDQGRLQHRVSSAVKRVCLYEPEDRLQQSDYSPCATAAWAGAKPQIADAIARSQAMALAGQPSVMATSITVAAR